MTATKNRVPHPGWACCDPTQDLAGWLRTERARIAIMWRWVAVLHKRGRRLRAAAGRAWARSDDATGRDLDARSRDAHLIGNCRAQQALIRAGRADDIEAAHQYRLAPPASQLPLL